MATLTSRSIKAQTANNAELEELAAIRAAANSGTESPAPRFAFLRGVNASLTTSSQHNSSSGWTSIFYPSLSWRMNRHFGVDATVPAYNYLDAYIDVGTAEKPLFAKQSEKGVWGDTVLTFEGDAPIRSFGYSGLFSLGLPTGAVGYGVGAGQVTYSFNNWFQRDIGRFTPNVALGYANTSSLINQGVLRNYVAVGPLAHFQAGTSFALTRTITFNAAAYEELPLDTDLIFSTTIKGKKKITTSTNADPGEDNGFVTSLAIPFSPRFSMAGFYSRSLRDHTDIAGFSFTLTARGTRAAE